MEHSYSSEEPAYPTPSLKVGRTGILTASAVLFVISATIALIGAIFAFYVTSLLPLYYYYFGMSNGVEFGFLMVAGILGILGFVSGLVSGVQSLRRKQFAICISGATLLLLAGTMQFVSTIVFPYSGSITFSVFFGVPITILTIFGLIFLIIRRNEFS